MERVIILSRDALFSEMLKNTVTEVLPTADVVLSSEGLPPAEKIRELVLAEVEGLAPGTLAGLKKRKDARFIFFAGQNALRAELPDRAEAVFERPFPVKLLRETLVRLSRKTCPPQTAAAAVKEGSGLEREGEGFSYRGERLLLTPTENTLLDCLYRANGKILTKEEISREVWGKTDVSSNNLNVYINYLRNKLDDRFGVKLIKTIHGKGFCLNI